MNAALPLTAHATPSLPAPVLVLTRQEKASPLRSAMLGMGLAGLLHLALLSAFLHNVDETSEPVTPPRPYIAISIVTPDTPKPTPVQPRPTPQPAVTKQQNTVPIQPATASKPVSQATLTSAATATNAIEATAPAAQAAPAVPPAQSPAKETAPSIVPPRFDAAYLSNPAPDYPRLSRRLGEEGRVLLKVHVGVDGKPVEVTVARSSGFPRLDDSARDTVLHSWRFVPAHQGEQAVAGTVKVPIDFTLNPAS